MGELTQEEMGRLRVRLADLPGFDPVGLTAHVDASGRSDDHRLGVYVPGGPGRDTGVSGIPPYHWVWHGEDLYDPDVWCMSTVSTADARTRDALARWIMSHDAGMKIRRCTAPNFRSWVTHKAIGWHITNGPGWSASQSAVDDYRALLVPGLADLHPNDPGHERVLPDGSRWVDAAALAEVVRHLGGARGE